MTLQTLHPTKFDRGRIIAQTPYPGIEHGAKTVEELLALTAPLGAKMLVQSLRDGLFVPPIREVGWCSGQSESANFTYASKIGPEDRHLDWATWSASEILRRQRVIGPLWNTIASLSIDGKEERKEAKRVIWDHGFRLLEDECHLFPATGHPIIVGLHGSAPLVYIRTCDGKILIANSIKIEGGITTEAFRAAISSGLAPIPKEFGKIKQLPYDFVTFHSRLD